MPTNPTTCCVRAGIDRDTSFGSVVPPLYLSSNFSFEDFGKQRRYDYSRSGNPTRDLLSSAIAEYEGGAGGVVTASGMAAIALVLQLLEPGDQLVIPHDCYGGSHRLFHSWAQKGQFELITTDLTDPRSLEAALARSPRIVWVETPSNPLLRLTDIRRVSQAAHQIGALVVVDNTFLSPALQRPIALGADIVVHSTTKYINGHSDVVGGAVVAADAALADELDAWANTIGLSGAPFDSYLTLRGLRTLEARLRVHEENAKELASMLDAHPGVLATHYPGLTSHPNHELAKSQQKGFGAMLSFELAGGVDSVRAFLDGLSCITLAESLGGVESLVAHPATMTHATMPPDAQVHAGITEGLLRISVGIEHIDDLKADIRAGLERVTDRTYPKKIAV